jgi:hypothetical protein
MVLGDDFYRIEIAEDGDIGMTFYFFYQAGLYFSTSIVFMMENTEFRMSEKYSEQTTAAEAFANSAGIYAEFGKIVCISVGFIHFKGLEMHFRTKSFAGDDEKKILTEFAQLLAKFCTSREHTLCGHNIKEFDIPYICRRMLINGIPLPSILQISGKKPWEIAFIDTLELWKFGDYKNYTSLKLLTAVSARRKSAIS